MYRSLFPQDMFAALDRLQREMNRNLEFSPNIRGLTQGGFPAMNVGGTPTSVEIYAFAPGVDPAAFEVNLEKGVLMISGERKCEVPDETVKAMAHINERFSGRFRRVVSLPDDIDPEQIAARYRDGVLHISINRRAEAQPRRINVE